MPQRNNNTVKRPTIKRYPAPRRGLCVMVRIKFLDKENEGLGFLISRFSGSAFRSGEIIVPPEALPALAVENYKFTVLGKATHNQMALFRRHVPSPIEIEIG